MRICQFYFIFRYYHCILWKLYTPSLHMLLVALDVHTSSVSGEVSSCLLFICWSYHIKDGCISSSFGCWRRSDFIGRWWANWSLCGHLWWVVGVRSFLYVPWGSTLRVFLYRSERFTSINKGSLSCQNSASCPCKHVGHKCVMPYSQYFNLNHWKTRNRAYGEGFH